MLNRFWWLLDRKNALGVRYRNAVGRKRQLEHENAFLKELLAEALPNLDGYVIMAADKPGSLWSRIFAAISETKAQQETSSPNSPDTAHKAG